MIIYDEQLWSANHNFISSEVFNKDNWTLYTKHDYAIFNPFHTWMEYINRLIGAISGLLLSSCSRCLLGIGIPKEKLSS